MERQIKVALFCGGRGGSTIVRELLRRPQIDLSLVINAYDHGLSTGALRDLIPGMLGPSDFRKNLSMLLEFYSPKQYAISSLLEFRLPTSFGEKDISSLEEFSKNGRVENLPSTIRPLLAGLDPSTLVRAKEYLLCFFSYYRSHGHSFEFADCSFGNLLFAGAFLKNGFNFNQVVEEFRALFRCTSKLINVTPGENRILVALKENGDILTCEDQIVAPQNPSPIRNLFLLPEELAPEQLMNLGGLDFEQKERALGQMEKPVSVSPEAKAALAGADIIVYGPGTQHSSLFPSYKTQGVREAIRESRAKIKVFVANIAQDHDIQSSSLKDIVDGALCYLGDPKNANRSITHIFYNAKSGERFNGLNSGFDFTTGESTYLGAEVLAQDFEHPISQESHSGEATVRALLETYESSEVGFNNDLLIYVDLNERSLAVKQLLEEFSDVDWKERFGQVKLILNCNQLPKVELPSYLSVESVNEASANSEVRFFLNWLHTGKSRYLATLTGDGEYRLRDIIRGVEILKYGSGSAVYGSRSQSRKQLYQSLRSAYGESKLLYSLGTLASFIFSLVFWFRFRLIFSDPLTGFRIYSRPALIRAKIQEQSKKVPRSPSAITKLLIQNAAEIAEIPIVYVTFEGFTNIRWRLMRSLRSLVGLFTPI